MGSYQSVWIVEMNQVQFHTNLHFIKTLLGPLYRPIGGEIYLTFTFDMSHIGGLNETSLPVLKKNVFYSEINELNIF